MKLTEDEILVLKYLKAQRDQQKLGSEQFGQAVLSLKRQNLITHIIGGDVTPAGRQALAELRKP